LERAEDWMRKLRASDLQPNVVCYSALILAYSRMGDSKKAEAALLAMPEDGVTPNVQCYNNVISACARSRSADRAELWLARMIEDGVTPNSSSYAGVVDAFSRIGDTERAEKTLRSMHSKGIRPNAESYTFLARAHARNGAVAQVEALASEMVSNGIPVDEYFLTVQLGVYATARPRQSARAAEIFLDATANGTQVNQHVVASLTRAVGYAEAQRLSTEAKQTKPRAPPPGLEQKQKHMRFPKAPCGKF